MADPIVEGARVPVSTYRLQFSRDFTFVHAAELIDYLEALGIGDVYASPLLMARAGSAHGYDVVDPTRLNPELGKEDEFRGLAGELRARGMGLVMDVVPNHMCVSDPRNRWWADVLENGPSSPFARFFDIDWQPPKTDLANQVLLPVLGDQYGRVLENQEISVEYREGAFFVRYYDLLLPLAPRTAPRILEPALRQLRARLGESHPHVLELESVITSLQHLPQRTETDRARVRERQREKEIAKRRLAAVADTDAEFRRALAATLADLNGVKGDPRSFDRLEALLAEQAYRLSSWRVAADEINFRRFFDINELAAIRIEEPPVFAAVHEQILRLLRKGLATGLRIDHVDGLFDPAGYLEALERASRQEGRPSYIVVEKVLESGERLRGWPVHGTTGYDFMNVLNGLFVDPASGRAFRDLYARFTGVTGSFADILYLSKRLVLRVSMSSELTVLARRLDRISEQHRWSRDFTLQSLQDALQEVVACFPVYRTYLRPDAEPPSPEDRAHIGTAIRAAKRRNPAISTSIFDYIRSVLLLEVPDGLDETERAERREFVMRFQQLTGPVTAKGLEDTAFYRYYPLASLNEVGGSPERFGVAPEAFHRANLERLENWPHSLSATSTHDTKRSEDVRARLDALSEMPEAWERAIARWSEMNRGFRKTQVMGGPEVPDPNAEYLLYQTLVGAWPFGPLDGPARSRFVERIEAYMNKALKEAKVHTSWVSPDEEYDGAMREFIRAILDPERGGEFLDDLLAFTVPVAHAGMMTSLSMTLLKIAAPGVPDFFQGTELFDLSLVDPDNRRPVDYGRRRAFLAEIREEAERDPAAIAERLLGSPEDGRVKLFVTSRALAFRAAHREVFARGAYVPLEPRGERANHAVAFARRAGPSVALAAAGRFFTRIGGPGRPPVGRAAFADTVLPLGEGVEPGRYRDALTGAEIDSRAGEAGPHLPLAEVFARLPVALLERVP